MTQPALSQTRSVADIEESKWVLQLFKEKVDRLENHSFRAYYQENGLRFSGKVNPETGQWEWEWNAPSEDSTDSFFLTFRMFYQDQDEISLSRLTQRYRTLPIEVERQKKWEKAYIAYKRFLKAKSTLVSGPVQYSRRAMLDMILYGHRAHVKLEQRRKIEPWLANDGLRALLETRSAEILEAIIKHLISYRAFNEETLAELERVIEEDGTS